MNRNQSIFANFPFILLIITHELTSILLSIFSMFVSVFSYLPMKKFHICFMFLIFTYGKFAYLFHVSHIYLWKKVHICFIFLQVPMKNLPYFSCFFHICFLFFSCFSHISIMFLPYFCKKFP